MEETCQAIAETLGFPVFVKPANAGSSVGVNKATDMETLREAIQIAFSHDCKVVIEEFIDGKELEVAVFGYDAPFASYVGEIQPAAEFYDYEDKYITGTSQLFIPARITDAQSDMLRETAVKALGTGLQGLVESRLLSAKGWRYHSERNQHSAGLHQYQHVSEADGTSWHVTGIFSG